MSSQAGGDAGIQMSKWAAGVVLGLILAAFGWVWALSARLTIADARVTALEVRMATGEKKVSDAMDYYNQVHNEQIRRNTIEELEAKKGKR